MALVYITEDDESIKEIEELALKNAGHTVCGFGCARSFYEGIEKKIPDLCIIDLMLPDENGNTIIRKLRADRRTKNIPVIIVTAKTTEMDLVRGMEDGADDYIKKPFSVMEFLSRVKSLLRRTMTEEIKEDRIDDLIVNHEKHEVTVKGIPVVLTYKEYELLSYMVRRKGIVMTRDNIMTGVWGTDFIGESRTIDIHINTLRKKLGEEYGNRIRTIRNVGYVIE